MYAVRAWGGRVPERHTTVNVVACQIFVDALEAGDAIDDNGVGLNSRTGRRFMCRM